jgi:prepilin-type N-terminal cleavage/methylation domain-containing protein
LNRRASLPGFTLIEMSIVLVIIGLIVGGILVGQTLIKAAQIRGVIKEEVQFETAVNTFFGKYDCMPGDCANITTFLPAATGCGTLSPSGGVCNGNGDGLVCGSAADDAKRGKFL